LRNPLYAFFPVVGLALLFRKLSFASVNLPGIFQALPHVSVRRGYRLEIFFLIDCFFSFLSSRAEIRVSNPGFPSSFPLICGVRSISRFANPSVWSRKDVLFLTPIPPIALLATFWERLPPTDKRFLDFRPLSRQRHFRFLPPTSDLVGFCSSTVRLYERRALFTSSTHESPCGRSLCFF